MVCASRYFQYTTPWYHVTNVHIINSIVSHLKWRPSFSFPSGSADSLTNGAALGIAVATTAVVFFIAGVIGGTLATIVVYHCMKQSRSTKPVSLQQTVPEYEEVIQLSENKAYGPTQSIEVRTNEADQPM